MGGWNTKQKTHPLRLRCEEGGGAVFAAEEFDAVGDDGDVFGCDGGLKAVVHSGVFELFVELIELGGVGGVVVFGGGTADEEGLTGPIYLYDACLDGGEEVLFGEAAATVERDADWAARELFGQAGLSGNVLGGEGRKAIGREAVAGAYAWGPKDDLARVGGFHTAKKIAGSFKRGEAVVHTCFHFKNGRGAIGVRNGGELAEKGNVLLFGKLGGIHGDSGGAKEEGTSVSSNRYTLNGGGEDRDGLWAFDVIGMEYYGDGAVEWAIRKDGQVCQIAGKAEDGIPCAEATALELPEAGLDDDRGGR